MSSQTQPHPAHVASATRRHLHAQLRAQPRGLLLEPARARPAASPRSSRPCRSDGPRRCARRGAGRRARRAPASARCRRRSRPRWRKDGLAGRARRAASMRGSSPAQPRRCASNTPQPYAASIASSDAVGRGLTSSVHARSPSQMKSTPNSPRSANAAARREQIARAWSSSAPLAGRQARRDEVPAPAVAADAERALPDELLGEPEHDGVHRRRPPPPPSTRARRCAPARTSRPAARRRATRARAMPPPPRSGLRSQRPEDGARDGRPRVREVARAPRRAARDRARRAASPAGCPAARAARPAARRAPGWFSKLAP